MKFDIKFKTIDHSQALVDYTVARFDKLDKFEIKPITVHVTFSEEHHNCTVEVYVHGLHGNFKAGFSSDNFHVSLDMCVKRIERQMEREKERIKHHHHYEQSAEGQLELALAVAARERSQRPA